MFNDELNGMKMNIPDDEIGHDVVSHFYNAAKAYNTVEFYDHFNQIKGYGTQGKAANISNQFDFIDGAGHFVREIGTILYIEYLV
ncbi:hypothetical protein H5410_023341 [Solanum commersonii]|uniref:Uncharacterized protein n=1 Tax=Solanum commersonii TaxID=4109 RepID=A0A9J5ZJG7_SOLCO|nr:hypothetical protein H5410_023341 [Solanum commersonii]